MIHQCHMSRLKWLTLVLVVVLGFVGASLGGADRGTPDRTIEAEKFALLNGLGAKVCVLDTSAQGPRMTMSDRQDRIRATLGITEVGPSLSLFDNHQKHRLVVGETNGMVMIGLLGRTGQARLGIWVDQAGEPSIITVDQKHRISWAAPPPNRAVTK